MRLFVVGDHHEDHDSLERAVDYISTQNPCLLVHLGDFSHNPYTQAMADELKRTGDVHRFLHEKRAYNEAHIRHDRDLLDRSGVPYLVIPGNYDPNLITLFGQRDMHARAIPVDGVMFAGYGGWMRQPGHIAPLVRSGEIVPYDERELFRTVVETEPDILLLHGPASGLNDRITSGEHVGSKAAAAAIDVVKPYLVLSGHIHEARGVTVANRANGGVTVAVNPGNVGVVNPEPHRRTFAGIETDENGRAMNVTLYYLTEKGVRPGETTDLSNVYTRNGSLAN
ncbi:MAG: metallophosphoesterase family protein [Candidatus Woesearchaeota archaeon]